MIFDEFYRVTRSRPCLVCGKPDWCLNAKDGSKAVCQRLETERPWGDAGWLHVLREDKATRPVTRARSVTESIYTRPAANWGAVQSQLSRDAWNKAHPETLANSLGVSSLSMAAMGIGWDQQDERWTFPMRDAIGNVVGIRTREADGSKRAMSGSDSGLFYQIRQCVDIPGTIWIVEGPTDAAALITIGLYPLGRPSCNSGNEMVAEFLWRHVRHVVIVADDDDPDRLGRRPGIEGALSLAASIRQYCRSLKVIHPLEGKDSRAWVNAGATAKLFESVANMAPFYRSVK